MIYFKDKDNQVHAYTENAMEKVARLTELEAILYEKEPAYTEAYDTLQTSTTELNEAIARRDSMATNDETSDDASEIESDINLKTENYNNALAKFNKIESEYSPIKSEHDEIPLVFFKIRENVNSMHKMSQKEVEVHINPPVTREQQITEAEAEKQRLIAEVHTETEMLRAKLALKRIKPDEEALLIARLDYLDELEAVDVSAAPDIIWPVKPAV